MTKRLKELFKELPNNNYNVMKTAKKVGYSDSYANSLIHKTIRKYMEAEEKEVKAEFVYSLDKDIKRFKREGDNSSYMRAKELKTKVLGLQLDRSEVNNKNPDKLIIVYDKQKPTPKVGGISS